MSQRDSGYERKERDLYETPEWVTEALLPHLPQLGLPHATSAIWEPACGSGKMVRALQKGGFNVIASDIEADGAPIKMDFLLRFPLAFLGQVRGVVTNPPYELAQEFCEYALELMERCDGFVAMLLRTDFDHAKSRAHLFRDCPAFSKKLVLMKRIAWFVEANGKPKGSPSFNHAWYIWDWKHEGAPTLAYGP